MPSGGARVGAGRKKGYSPVAPEDKKIMKSFRIDPNLFREFEEIFPEKKIISKLEEAMRNYIEKNNNQK